MSLFSGSKAQQIIGDAQEIHFNEVVSGNFPTGSERHRYKILIAANQEFKSVLILPDGLHHTIQYYADLWRVDIIATTQGSTEVEIFLTTLDDIANGSPVAHGDGGSGDSLVFPNYEIDRTYIYTISSRNLTPSDSSFEFHVEAVP